MPLELFQAHANVSGRSVFRFSSVINYHVRDGAANYWLMVTIK